MKKWEFMICTEKVNRISCDVALQRFYAVPRNFEGTTEKTLKKGLNGIYLSENTTKKELKEFYATRLIA